MKVFIYIISALILMLIESSLASRFPMDLFKPDFGTPFIVYATFFMGPSPGFIVALATGFFQETLSGALHGSILFTVISFFLVAAFMRKRVYIDSRYSFAGMCFSAVLFQSLLFLILSVLAKGEAKNVYNIIFYAIPNAVVTALFSLLIYGLIEYLNTAFPDRE